jgi:hypothetical protein
MASLSSFLDSRPSTFGRAWACVALCAALALPLATAGCGGDNTSAGGMGGRCVVAGNAQIPLQWQGTIGGGGTNAAWQMSLKGGTANVVDMFISGQGPGGGTIVADLTGGRNGCQCNLRGSASESVPNMPAGARYSMVLDGKFEDQGGAVVFKGVWQLMTIGQNYNGEIQGSAVGGSAHIDTSVLPIPGAMPPPGGTMTDTAGGGSIPGVDTGGGTGPGMDIPAGFDPGMGGFDPGMGGHDPGMGGFDPGMGGFDPGMSFDPGEGGFDPGMSYDIPQYDPGSPDPGGTEVPCQGVSFAGCCAGNVLKYCEANEVKEVTCPTSCGWDAGKGFYNCDHEGPDPSEEHVHACPGFE